MGQFTQPDFVMIPTQLLQDQNLQPTDRILFGYIYWMTKLALMKCIASNGTLAELTGSSERGIRASLERLEQQGYIGRIYQGEGNRNRVEIECRLAFSAVPLQVASVSPTTTQEVGTNVPSRRNKRAVEVGTNVPHNKKIEKEDIKRSNTTNVVLAKADKSSESINQLFLYWHERTGIAIQSQVRANRFACSNLLKRYSTDQVQQLIEGVVKAQSDRYAPRISDFRDLQSKLNQLLTWGKAQTTTKKGTIKI